jgi:hypothetical protein
MLALSRQDKAGALYKPGGLQSAPFAMQAVNRAEPEASAPDTVAKSR